VRVTRRPPRRRARAPSGRRPGPGPHGGPGAGGWGTVGTARQFFSGPVGDHLCCHLVGLPLLPPSMGYGYLKSRGRETPPEAQPEACLSMRTSKGPGHHEGGVTLEVEGGPEGHGAGKEPHHHRGLPGVVRHLNVLLHEVDHCEGRGGGGQLAW